MIITFLGNDGSGKTTISKEMYKFFRELGFDTIYKHEYDYVLLKYIFKIIGKKHLEESRKEMLIEQKKSWKYQFWPILVWIDVYLQFLYFKIFKRRKIILLDRYIYDHYMSFEYLGYLNRFTGWLYLHFPKPDIPLLLWVEPEIAYERKKETHTYEISFYKHQLEKYRNLAKILKIPDFNTNEDISRTKKKILKLFFSNKIFINIFINRCHQNRVLYYIIKKEELYSLNPLFKEVLNKLEDKQKDYINSLEFIQKFLNNKTWVLIDWRPYNHFPVHDIDIFVKSSDMYIKNQIVTTNMYFDIDIQDKVLGGHIEKSILSGLWAHVNFIKYNNLDIPIFKDNWAVILLKILKNGFVTLDQYRYLKESVLTKNKAQKPTELQGINHLGTVIEYLEHIDIKKDTFPNFLPLKVMLRGLRNMNVNSVFLIRTLFFTMIGRIIFFIKGDMTFHR